MAEDYYQRLGAKQGDSEADLKKAYRKLAMKYHPDKNPGDDAAEKKFKEISEAYDTLKDPQKKAAYDRYGHDAFTSNGMGAAGGGQQGGGAGGFDFNGGFSDMFEDLFNEFGGGGRRQQGGGRANAGGSRGADLRYNLEISLEDAFRGKQQSITLTTSASCDTCEGSGAKKGSKPETCGTCGGVGVVRAQQGFFMVERTCHSCNGAGQTIKNPCKTCAGSGTQRKEKTLNVSIPAGVEEGTRIRLSGEGEAGSRGGTTGDLYIFMGIKAHRFFKRESANIHCNVPLPITTAALGGGIEVPTIDGGKVKVNIPEGTQAGHQFRLRGKGMSVLRSSSRGDMYIHVTVETPVKLSKKQKDLLNEFDKTGGGASSFSPESAGFFDKVKDFWEDLKE